ncbi:unnamed protein product [Lampetra fluviatilis]
MDCKGALRTTGGGFLCAQSAHADTPRVSPKSLSSNTSGPARFVSPTETSATISGCAVAGNLQYSDPSPQAHLTEAGNRDNASAFVGLKLLNKVDDGEQIAARNTLSLLGL